jgi:DNA-binding response OmpR family regulator
MARVRVFIFEDDEGFFDVLRALLATVPGFEVVGCSPRADEGLREVGRLAPDLVLLDMHLAQGDGFDVMDTLRRSGRRSMKVYALTSAWSRGLQSACLDSGADDCFDKADCAMLLERLERLIRARAPGRADRSAGSQP